MPGEALNSSRTVLGAVDEVLETAENYPGKFPKVDREHVLFDALSSQLSLAVCIEQFLLHITFPLLLPLFFRRYGRIFFYAQAFNSPISIINISVFYAMVLSAIMSTEKIGMQVVFPIGVYVIHRFMVALKYGTLSPSEYRKMMYGNSAGVKLHEAPNEKVKKVVAEYQSQLQLLSGWLRISDVLLEYELLTAAGRVGVDVHNYYFYLPNPENGKSEKVQFFRWQKLLSKAQDGQIRGMNSHPDGSYTVSVHHACVAILRKTEPTFIRQVVTTIWFFLSFCNACIPIIAVAYDNGLKELSAWAWVYYMTSFFINFGYSFAILSFVLTSFVDTYRRFKSAEYLDSLIRVADVDLNIKLRVGNGAGSQLHESELYTVNRLLERSSTFKFEEAVGDVEMKKSESECGPENADLKKNYNHSDVYAPKSLEFGQDIIDEFSEIIPKLDMKYASNYVAWAVCRTQLNDFGARIRFRLDVYNATVLFLSLLLIIALSVTFIHDSGLIYEVNTPLLHAVVWVYLFSFCEAGIIFAGHLVNVFLSRHRSSIALHMLIIKRKYHQYKARNFSAIDGLNDKNALQESKEIVHSADVVLQVLHNRCTVDQVRVLGIKCHSQQSLWIISTLLLSSFAVMQFAILGKSSFA